MTTWFEINPITDALGGGRYRLPDPWADYCHVGEQVPIVWAGTTTWLTATVTGHSQTGEAIITPQETGST